MNITQDGEGWMEYLKLHPLKEDKEKTILKDKLKTTIDAGITKLPVVKININKLYKKLTDGK